MIDRTSLKQIPLLFVLLWSTGFIGTKFGLPYAEPFTFLMYRMYITVAAFLVLIRLFHAHWPDPRGALHSMVVGALVHACYLGGIFSAINTGMSAGSLCSFSPCFGWFSGCLSPR